MKPMQPAMPAGLPAKGQAFIRLGVKFHDGGKLRLDGKISTEQGLVVWVDTLGRLLGRHKVGQDEGIEAAFAPPTLSACSHCGAEVDQIIGCPSGAELCQTCFDEGKD